MKAVVGLGNPGPRYVHTRHNVGFHTVDGLAGQGVWERSETCVFTTVVPDDVRLVLVKPTTFMNRSGQAVAFVVAHFGLSLDDVLVVVDDVHLDVGRLRFRRGGSHGGHNGLRSIIEVLGASDFPRLRIGVGQPPACEDLIDYVLGVFAPEEQSDIESALQRATKGAVCWAMLGIEAAMNRFNA